MHIHVHFILEIGVTVSNPDARDRKWIYWMECRNKTSKQTVFYKSKSFIRIQRIQPKKHDQNPKSNNFDGLN